MLKPIQMLHLGAALCLLAGCATQGSATDEVRDQTTTTSTDIQEKESTDSTVATMPLPTARLEPIQAGESTPVNRGFTQADGRLEPNIQAFANEVAHTRNIPQALVDDVLSQARYDAQVVKLMAPRKTPLRRSWSTYRQRSIDSSRIEAGVRFWEDHRDVLAAVEQQYGVPAAVIVAIIGVETIYGRFLGDFRVLDSLATLGFRYPDPSRPERAHMFRNQLADLLLLHHMGELDALAARGSYAGAMGLPQFMPGSVLRYAVDGDGDGHIDLMHSTSDAIASVASFLRHHGWVPGLPIFAPVDLPAQAKTLLTGGIDPSTDWAALQALGARVSSPASDQQWQTQPLGVIDLVEESQHTAEYRVGTPNFFAITHYNRSYFYASAVAEFAQELASRLETNPN